MLQSCSVLTEVNIDAGSGLEPMPPRSTDRRRNVQIAKSKKSGIFSRKISLSRYLLIQVRAHTFIMSTKTITITEEAYNRLKSRKGVNQSFSEVIIQNFPSKRKLSEVLAEIGQDDVLADRIEAASKEMRQSKMREVDF